MKTLKKINVNLKHYDRILIPVLNNSNWCLVSVNLENKVLIFYDSHNNRNEEMKNKKTEILNNISSFIDYYLEKSSGTCNNLFTNKFEFMKEKINLKKSRMNSSDKITNYYSTHTIDSNMNTDLEEECELRSDVDKSFNSEEVDENEEYENSNNNIEINLDSVSLPTYSSNSNWKFNWAKCPIQTNSNDGGVYICKFIEFLSRAEPITFSSDDIQYFRLMMCTEILEMSLYTV